MADFQPSRQQSDLADVIEMLLDKGVVINADIAVSIGDTQLLGIQVRAAIASFDTAARYGLEFPEGTDMRRMAEEVGDPEIAEMDRPRVPIDPTRSVNVTAGDEVSDQDEGDEQVTDDASTDDGDDDLLGGDDRGTERLGARPDPETPTGDGLTDAGDVAEAATDAVTDDEADSDAGDEADSDARDEATAGGSDDTEGAS